MTFLIFCKGLVRLICFVFIKTRLILFQKLVKLIIQNVLLEPPQQVEGVSRVLIFDKVPPSKIKILSYVNFSQIQTNITFNFINTHAL